jgi:hypothetical protein
MRCWTARTHAVDAENTVLLWELLHKRHGTTANPHCCFCQIGEACRTLPQWPPSQGVS